MHIQLFGRDELDYKIGDISLYDIVNYNEILVMEALKEAISSGEVGCRCGLCLEDIYALTLNALPPRYIQSTGIEHYKRTHNYIGIEEVKKKLAESIYKVHNNPYHS
ncbi:MAG: late competence development ComFB family protein [Oligoflexia bacterium]|nr:late competence development ComFB family protein [Oligoflexia bacterium]MBF0365907.1 late competence development ComFB family protein [Oligoflexia bacterium]